MNTFSHYLKIQGEVGRVEKVFQSLLYVEGLPGLHPSEIVVFESGELGQVMSLGQEFAEVMLLSRTQVGVDTRVARTNTTISVDVGEFLLGNVFNALGESEKRAFNQESEKRYIFREPLGIGSRKNIDTTFETGVSLVDLIVSLGMGQRELIVGDRKSGKTQFLLQCVESAAKKGIVCIYAAIAKKRQDIDAINQYFVKQGVSGNVIMVASGSSDPTPLVYLTPYTAMTYAEYFRDKGKDTLVVLDDMTAHAKYYREISLLANRFPGRSSYPGDIFYIHSQLMERAGNFTVTRKDGDKVLRHSASITCLPVAELVMGDLSGYIQTNLMSMTDGHIYFDNNIYNKGRRPAINTFISVTRVGKQAQTSLVRDISSVLNSFLVHLNELEQFVHFGAELSIESKEDLKKGNQLRDLLDQSYTTIVPLSVSIILVASLWANLYKDKQTEELRSTKQTIIQRYSTDTQFKTMLDTIVSSSTNFDALIEVVKTQNFS